MFFLVSVFFFVVVVVVGVCWIHVVSSNRASQQLLPEREGVYLTESRQAVYGGSSAGPQLEEREEKESTEMRNHLGNNLGDLSLLLFRELRVFMPKILRKSTKIFHLNKGPASHSSSSQFLYEGILMTACLDVSALICKMFLLVCKKKTPTFAQNAQAL